MSEDDGSERRRWRRCDRSLPAAKLATYDGTKSFDPFIFQFKRVAKKYRWSNSKKFDRLILLLRGKALSFVTYSRIRSDYHRLRRKLRQHFQLDVTPAASRRSLFSLVQEGTESVEDFADRVFHAVVIGYNYAEEKVWQRLAVDAFLKGCQDRHATLWVFHQKPKTLSKGIKLLKESVTTNKLCQNDQSGAGASKNKFPYFVKQSALASKKESSDSSEDESCVKQVRWQTSPQKKAENGNDKKSANIENTASRAEMSSFETLATKLSETIVKVLREELRPRDKSNGNSSDPNRNRYRSPESGGSS